MIGLIRGLRLLIFVWGDGREQLCSDSAWIQRELTSSRSNAERKQSHQQYVLRYPYHFTILVIVAGNGVYIEGVLIVEEIPVLKAISVSLQESYILT